MDKVALVITLSFVGFIAIIVFLRVYFGN